MKAISKNTRHNIYFNTVARPLLSLSDIDIARVCRFSAFFNLCRRCSLSAHPLLNDICWLKESRAGSCVI